jgi:hypothetical protein
MTEPTTNITIDKQVPGYWRATLDNPPINTVHDRMYDEVSLTSWKLRERQPRLLSRPLDATWTSKRCNRAQQQRFEVASEKDSPARGRSVDAAARSRGPCGQRKELISRNFSEALRRSRTVASDGVEPSTPPYHPACLSRFRSGAICERLPPFCPLGSINAPYLRWSSAVDHRHVPPFLTLACGPAGSRVVTPHRHSTAPSWRRKS